MWIVDLVVAKCLPLVEVKDRAQLQYKVNQLFNQDYLQQNSLSMGTQLYFINYIERIFANCHSALRLDEVIQLLQGTLMVAEKMNYNSSIINCDFIKLFNKNCFSQDLFYPELMPQQLLSRFNQILITGEFNKPQSLLYSLMREDSDITFILRHFNIDFHYLLECLKTSLPQPKSHPLTITALAQDNLHQQPTKSQGVSLLHQLDLTDSITDLTMQRYRYIYNRINRILIKNHGSHYFSLVNLYQRVGSKLNQNVQELLKQVLCYKVEKNWHGLYKRHLLNVVTGVTLPNDIVKLSLKGKAAVVYDEVALLLYDNMSSYLANRRRVEKDLVALIKEENLNCMEAKVLQCLEYNSEYDKDCVIRFLSSLRCDNKVMTSFLQELAYYALVPNGFHDEKLNSDNFSWVNLLLTEKQAKQAGIVSNMTIRRSPTCMNLITLDRGQSDAPALVARDDCQDRPSLSSFDDIAEIGELEMDYADLEPGYTQSDDDSDSGKADITFFKPLYSKLEQMGSMDFNDPKNPGLE